MGWLPGDLDTWVEVEIPNPKFQTPRRIYVGRYPVTNHQFARFIAADGYKERGRRWWSDEGWAWRIEKHDSYRGEDPVTQPEYWDHPRFGKNRRGYPVVGVSWYEANAYCAWLTEELEVSGFKFRVWHGGKPETLNLGSETLTVRLPTEAEWVAAAGGEEGDRYPWGTKWHESCANTREGGIDGTTPVAMYPSGQSLPGVWDMGGNVWEWMRSWYDEEHRRRALRGGSWYGDREFARVRARVRLGPDRSYFNGGFRVVVSPAGAGS
jgi:formylglycine-generating enzyme required for sulfatase activity